MRRIAEITHSLTKMRSTAIVHNKKMVLTTIRSFINAWYCENTGIWRRLRSVFTGGTSCSFFVFFPTGLVSCSSSLFLLRNFSFIFVTQYYYLFPFIKMLLSLHFSALSSETLDTLIKFILVIDERYGELLFKTMDQGNEVE